MTLRFAALIVSISLSVQAFAPSTRCPVARSCKPVFAGPEITSEEDLRQEIARKNSELDNEGKYAVADGEGIGTLIEDNGSSGESTSEAASSSSDQSFRAKLDRMIEPRAYPLFVVEKAAEIVESTVQDFTKILKSDSTVDSENVNGKKQKVVVLGTGWGSAAFLKDINADLYDVTVISPRNYFLFTPMLAGSSVGTVEYRSITEPVREINRKTSFLEATATEIDPENKVITCESVVCDGSNCNIQDFTVDYDMLIVSIGAQTNTFGIPGVREYCDFLKSIEDARSIRTSIINSFERASLPNLSEQERIGNLTFAVIGAGPTGVEFAAELRDFVEQDAPRYYPNLIKDVRIKVIEASSTVLAPFDKALQQEAISQMKRQIEIKNEDVLDMLPSSFELVELCLDSSVKEVTEQSIVLNDGTSIDYSIAVWAAGNGPLPLTLDLIEKLGPEQAEEQSTSRGRVAIDSWMRAIGSKGSILAFGDCSCNTKRALPATAQVASQQGEYLAKLFNNQYNFSPELLEDGILPPPEHASEQTLSLSDMIANFACKNPGNYAKPFQFLELGILAYTGGGSALAQVSTIPEGAPLKGTGKLGNAVWRSVYLSKQVSWRNRFMVISDWLNKQLFGRDISRI